MKNRGNVSTLLVLVSLYLMAGGCSGVQPAGPADQETVQLPVGIIAVMPPAADTAGQQDNKVVPGQLEAGIDMMNTLLAEYFGDRNDIRLVSEKQQEGLTAESTGSRQMLARGIGRRLGADAVLLLSLSRYQPREGTTYSVTRPASAAFEYRLFITETGQLICSGVFDETQQPLFENILSFSRATRRGFRWLTAGELLSEGLRRKFSACPYLQQ